MLFPYEGEFETDEELIEILEKITKKVNTYVCQETGVPPMLLFQKEKEYLQPLPNSQVIESYQNHDCQTTVRKDSMISYKNRRYSISPEYIRKPVSIRLLLINSFSYNMGIIAKHHLSSKRLNYQREHCKNSLSYYAYDVNIVTEIVEDNIR